MSYCIHQIRDNEDSVKLNYLSETQYQMYSTNQTTTDQIFDYQSQNTYIPEQKNNFYTSDNFDNTSYRAKEYLIYDSEEEINPQEDPIESLHDREDSVSNDDDNDDNHKLDNNENHRYINEQQQQQFLHIQNGTCQLLEKVKGGIQIDQNIQEFNALVLKCATNRNINLEGKKCYFSSNQKIFVLYDSQISSFIFFEFENNQETHFFEVRFNLKKESKFCINDKENIMYISSQVNANDTIIESFMFNIQLNQFQLLEEENVITLKNSKIVHLYYQNEIKYAYKKIRQNKSENEDLKQDDLILLNDDEYTEYECMYFDIYNNYISCTNSDLFYNDNTICNYKYKQEIEMIISYLKQAQSDSSILMLFKQEQKYKYQYEFHALFIQNQSQKNYFKIPFQIDQSD